MVNKDQVKKTLEQVKKNSKKRKFAQAVDLIINFKNIDLKKNPIDLFITLPNSFTKKPKICAIVGDEFIKKSEGDCDKVIGKTELEKWNDVRQVKKLGREYSFFVAQANLMGLIATKFGRTLGPLAKMPNPKFGGVIPPGAELKPVVDKFRKSVRIMCKNELIIKTKVAYEDMEDDQITNNIMHIYDTISNSLPHHEHNVKSTILKLTMGKPLLIGAKKTSEEEPSEEKKVEEKKPKEEKLLEKPSSKDEEKKDE
ncbi:MAG: hypothetical protein CMH64_03590 [Nanoarchaeota archaeon]|nr:hypothetical protein [Nanoarchaeota archaeon]|tara:strand:- start:2751 stop:3515 length:765 start_codon:yes stop_codon:yes gene_type:complete